MTAPGRTALLLGRKGIDTEAYQARFGDSVHILGGRNLEDVLQAFENHEIDMVVMGAGIALEDRLEIVAHVFKVSDTTSVHMKDRASGPGGMMAFVEGVISGRWPTG